MHEERLFRYACIITHSLLTRDGNQREIGGVQIYTDALCRVLQKRADRIFVLQSADISFRRELNATIEVIGVPGEPHVQEGGQELRHFYQQEFQRKMDLTIFAHVPWGDWSKGERSVAIHHGIYWDGFDTPRKSLIRKLQEYNVLRKFRRDRRVLRRVLRKVNKMVCVDLNFINWLRAYWPCENWEDKLVYVPNFGDPMEKTQLEMKLNLSREEIIVLLPRRFEIYRGMVLFAELVKEIHAQWPKVHFIFAGHGSQKAKLEQILKDCPNSSIVHKSYVQIMEEYNKADIVVVPSLWSEGTSLACIEGMCHGAAMLVTNVGGLGNLIVPDYNGVIVSPTKSAIRCGLEKLLSCVELRKNLARQGYNMAVNSFSRAVWESRMDEVFVNL